MKKITNYFKHLVLVGALLHIQHADAQCSLNASFSITQVGNGSVLFQSTSTGTVPGTTYSWAYGNPITFGLPNTGQGVSSYGGYAANGTYIATLTANNNYTPTPCISTATQVVVITSTVNCSLVPSFTYTLGAGGVVNFSSTSTGTVSGATYYWTLNPGSASGPNATTTYTTNGNHVVTLMVNSGGCYLGMTQTITVNTAPCNLNANFSYTQGSNGLINFSSNSSTGVGGSATYTWNFGDNSGSSSASPAHTYSANGTYTAQLIINNNMSPACIDSVSIPVNVYSFCNLVAGFNYSQSNGNVVFTNTSTGTIPATGYIWNFGDGGPQGTTASPSHNYVNGTYTVTLTATNYSVSPLCQSTSTQVIVVNSNTCIANANFSLSPSGTPLYWNAIPASPGNITSAIWSWGDGSTSTTLFTSHTYSAAGTYSICLTVTVNCGVSTSTCSYYSIYKPSGSSQSLDMVHVNVIDPASVGINALQNNIGYFRVSPNPNNGSFNINMNGLDAGNVNIQVYNVTGELIFETTADTNNGAFDKNVRLKDAANGVYFVKVSSANKTFSKKVLIQNQ